MKTGVVLTVVVVLVAVGLSASSLASSGVTWKAELSATQEIPKQVVKNTGAQGTFMGTLSGSKLKFKLTFSGLTGSASAAHIHLGRLGKSGNVLLPLCAPCKRPVVKTVTVSNAVQTDFRKGLLYVNIHTAKNPNGEIRGQLGAAVPG